MSTISHGSMSQPSLQFSVTAGESVLCGKCHPTQQADWDMSAHAHAFDNPAFQEAWISQGEPEACLECHLSGIIPGEGDGDSQGVSCEMCHGPGLTMSMNITEKDCSKCHSYAHYPTYQEWLESEHGHYNLSCLECHDLPSLKLKAEDIISLCSKCHVDKTAEWEKGSHGVVENDCADCHLLRAISKLDRREHDVTGHTFYPGVPDPDCEYCHEQVVKGHMDWGVGPQGCLTCHNEIFMTKLHLTNGTTLAISESSVLCGQCHEKVYYEWKHQMHGSAHEDSSCTDCHVPWEPYVCWNETLPGVPFSVPSIANQVLTSSISYPPLPLYAFFVALSVLILSVFINGRSSNG